MSGNDRLRTAMASRQVTIEDIAARAEVDPKTVQRGLGGRTPHLRNRISVAAMVGEDPEYLWPETDRGRDEGARADDEVVATYAQRALVPGELWDQLIESATRRIDLLGFAMLHVPEQHPSIFEAGAASRRAAAAFGSFSPIPMENRPSDGTGRSSSTAGYCTESGRPPSTSRSSSPDPRRSSCGGRMPRCTARSSGSTTRRL